MSGTSFDGIDVCAISENKQIQLLGFSSFKYPTNLKNQIALTIEDQQLSLKDFGELNVKIGTAFSNAIISFITKNKISKNKICAIGLSGQTLWHQPRGRYPFSIQAGDPAVVARKCGIDVVSNFRNDHIKLGGEGAPLVPEFHQKIFSEPQQAKLILNIGGISNFSLVTKAQGFFGSDCGPGNALMDVFCQKKLNCSFDKNGRVARLGNVHMPSLKRMLADSFFKKRHPKSTGKELFNFNFIPKSLFIKTPEDILATLVELTAITISKSLKPKENLAKEIIVCGGGIKNSYLMERIAHHTSIPLTSSAQYGYDPQAIEAMAFGWLAKQRINEKPLLVKKAYGLLGSITNFK